MDLLQELSIKNQELSISIKTLREHGQALAYAEMNYKTTISKAVLKLRAEGLPATLINLVVYGEKEVAEKRLKRDIAKVMYDANNEHINVTKLQIRVIENQLQREYHS